MGLGDGWCIKIDARKEGAVVRKEDAIKWGHWFLESWSLDLEERCVLLLPPRPLAAAPPPPPSPASRRRRNGKSWARRQSTACLPPPLPLPLPLLSLGPTPTPLPWCWACSCRRSSTTSRASTGPSSTASPATAAVHSRYLLLPTIQPTRIIHLLRYALVSHSIAALSCPYLFLCAVTVCNVVCYSMLILTSEYV